MLDDCVCHGLGVQECGRVLAIAVSSFYSLVGFLPGGVYPEAELG